MPSDSIRALVFEFGKQGMNPSPGHEWLASGKDLSDLGRHHATDLERHGRRIRPVDQIGVQLGGADWRRRSKSTSNRGGLRLDESAKFSLSILFWWPTTPPFAGTERLSFDDRHVAGRGQRQRGLVAARDGPRRCAGGRRAHRLVHLLSNAPQLQTNVHWQLFPLRSQMHAPTLHPIGGMGGIPHFRLLCAIKSVGTFAPLRPCDLRKSTAEVTVRSGMDSEVLATLAIGSENTADDANTAVKANNDSEISFKSSSMVNDDGRILHLLHKLDTTRITKTDDASSQRVDLLPDFARSRARHAFCVCGGQAR